MKQPEHQSAKRQNVIYAQEFQAALHVNGPVLMARYSVLIFRRKKLECTPLNQHYRSD
jgi:hypothetical protein